MKIFKTVDLLRAWIQQEIAKEKLGIEKLPFVTREESEQDTDVIIDRVEVGERPILIRDRGRADALLSGWEDYLRRFTILHTPKEIAEIEAACFGMKEADNT